MHAFDFVMTFLSFVYAAAVAQVLNTTGEIIIAAKRIRLSVFNAGWMVVSLLAAGSWWIGLWDLRQREAWTMADVGVFFLIAAMQYILTRMVSPRIPHDGEVDLQAFHREEGGKYLWWFAAGATITIGVNIGYSAATGVGRWVAENVPVIPMALAAAAAAIWPRRRAVQATRLVVELAAWVVYYGVYQPPLRG